MPPKYEGAQRTDLLRWAPEDLDLIDATRNLRWKLIPARVEEMAARLAKEGQLEPGGVRKNAQGVTELIYGFYRLAALKLIRENPARFDLSSPLPFVAKPVTATDEQAASYNLSENLDRSGYTVVDIGFAAQRLEQVHGWTRKSIACRYRLTPTRIAQLVDLLRLPERVLDLVHVGRMGEALARQLFGLPAETIEAVAARIEEGERPALVMRDVLQLHRERGKQKPRPLAEIKDTLKNLDDPRAHALLCWMQGDPTVPLDEAFPARRKGVA